MKTLRAEDLNLAAGTLARGPLNKISDVAGVTVGHATVDTDHHKTGVTVVMPCKENPFTHKLPAASFVLNGFGKTTGLIQIDELGTLESPIALTGTLNVGLVHDALVEYLCRRCEEEGIPLRSVNPVVCECNDGTLSHSRHRAVGEAEVFAAIHGAAADFDEGCVGAGTGTICHGFKGGIGSASRRMEVDGAVYTMGALVQTNHGRMADLVIDGIAVGKPLAQKLENHTSDKGSVIVILATDLPLDSRQLGRVARRASVGLARLGSFIGHGSGEVFVAFSTANPTCPTDGKLRTVTAFREDEMDLPFRAAAECVEEAVVNSLLAGRRTVGYDGTVVEALTDHWTP